MKKPSVTSLARELGVSPSTVSRALRREAGVSPELGAEIFDLATKRGYRFPRQAASSPMGAEARQSFVLGLVLTPQVARFFNQGDSFYWRLVTEFQKGCTRRGCLGTLLASQKNTSYEHIHRAVEEGMVDAVVVHDTSLLRTRPLVLESIARRIPMVVLNTELFEIPVDCAVINYAAAAWLQINHLQTLGHRRISLFYPVTRGNEPALVRWSDEKFLALAEREAAALGLEVAPSGQALWTLDAVSEEEVIGGYVDALLSETPRPTAVLTYDIYAPPLLDALTVRGVRVPGDLSLIGNDDDLHGRTSPLPLTTMAWNMPALVDAAIDLVMRRRQNPFAPPQTTKIFPQLIVRESTAPSIGRTAASH